MSLGISCIPGLDNVDAKTAARFTDLFIKEGQDAALDDLISQLLNSEGVTAIKKDSSVASYYYNRSVGNDTAEDVIRLEAMGIKNILKNGEISISHTDSETKRILKKYKSMTDEEVKLMNSTYKPTAPIVTSINSLKDMLVELKEQHEKRWDNLDEVNKKSKARADEIVRNTLNPAKVDDPAYYFSIKRGPLTNAIKYLSSSNRHLIPIISSEDNFADYVNTRASVLLALRKKHSTIVIGDTTYDIGDVFIRAKTNRGNKNMGIGVTLTSNNGEKELILGTIPTHKEDAQGYSSQVDKLYTSILPEGTAENSIKVSPRLLNSMTSGAINRMGTKDKAIQNENWSEAKKRLVKAHPSTTFSNILIRTDNSEHGGDAYVVYSTTGASLTNMTQSDLMATLDKHISNKMNNLDTMVASDFGFIKLDRKPMKAKNMIDLIFKSKSLDITSADIPKLRRYIRTDGREKQYAAVVNSLYKSAVAYNALSSTSKKNRINLNGVDSSIEKMDLWLDRNPEYKTVGEYDTKIFEGETGKTFRGIVESLAEGDGTHAILKYTADESPMIDILHSITRMVTDGNDNGVLRLKSDERITKITNALDHILVNHKGFENGFHFNFGIDHKGSRDAMAFLEASPDGMDVEEFAGHTLQGTVASISPNGLLLDVAELTDIIKTPIPTTVPEVAPVTVQPVPEVPAVVAGDDVLSGLDALFKRLDGSRSDSKSAKVEQQKLIRDGKITKEQLKDKQIEYRLKAAVRFVKHEFITMVGDLSYKGTKPPRAITALPTEQKKKILESLNHLRDTATELRNAIKDKNIDKVSEIMVNNPEFVAEAVHGSTDTLTDEVGKLASATMDAIYESKGGNSEITTDLKKDLELIEHLYVTSDKKHTLGAEKSTLTDNMVIEETDEANVLLANLGWKAITDMDSLGSEIQKILVATMGGPIGEDLGNLSDEEIDALNDQQEEWIEDLRKLNENKCK